MDFKEYSELFHAAFNKRPNRIPTTRPKAELSKVYTEDYFLMESFTENYKRASEDLKQKYADLYNEVVDRSRNYYPYEFTFANDKQRQKVNSFLALVSSNRRRH